MNKKQAILDTAVRIFADKGYEAATTLQIARVVGVTEPAVLYHFKSKNDLFETILKAAVANYFQRLDGLVRSPFASAADSLEALIRMHFAIVDEEPKYMAVVLRTCPARLEEMGSPCVALYREVRTRLKAAAAGIIKQGVDLSEFRPVDVNATANMLIALLNGLMRQRLVAMDDLEGVVSATIDFCRQALVA